MIKGLYKIFDYWSEHGTVWLYSDTHFNDKELNDGIMARPDAETQIKNINSKVGKKDTLILLGDVGDIECARKLKGYKVLVCGNHDKGASNYEEVFDEVYTGPLMIGERVLLSHEPIDMDYALNIHGHVHNPHYKGDKYHLNMCADAIGYMPVNMNQLMKSGVLSGIQSLHREIIDNATARKQRRKK